MPKSKGIAEMLLLYALGAAAVVGIIAMSAYKVNHWCNAACQSAQAQRDELAAEKAAALKREAGIALLWSAQVDAAAIAEAKLEEVRRERFQAPRDAARALPRGVADVRVPASVVGVFDAATRAANAAGPAAEPRETAPPAAAAADSTAGMIADWFVTVAEIHAECRDRVAAWESFYRGLRTAQLEMPP